MGKIVMAAAAKHLTPVTLELGGKNPCYVDDNCDPQTVANRVAWFRYFNAGQTCVAPDYVLCSPETRERLLPALQQAITRFYGDDPQRSPNLGRIINQKQFRRLQALLGCGRVAIGGQSDESQRYIGEPLSSPSPRGRDPARPDHTPKPGPCCSSPGHGHSSGATIWWPKAPLSVAGAGLPPRHTLGHASAQCQARLSTPAPPPPRDPDPASPAPGSKRAPTSWAQDGLGVTSASRALRPRPPHRPPAHYCTQPPAPGAGPRSEPPVPAAPTVLVDVQEAEPVMQEEIFGPILPILTVSGLDEAVAFINRREKPLALYAFSNSSQVGPAGWGWGTGDSRGSGPSGQLGQLQDSPAWASWLHPRPCPGSSLSPLHLPPQPGPLQGSPHLRVPHPGPSGLKVARWG